jgi:hypothetical protein
LIEREVINWNFISDFIRFEAANCNLIAGVSYGNLVDAKDNCQLRDDCVGVLSLPNCGGIIPNGMPFGLCDKILDSESSTCFSGPEDRLVYNRLQLSGTEMIYFLFRYKQ